MTAKCYGGDITPQAQAPREAERGQEAHEAGRERRDPAGGVPRHPEGRLKPAALKLDSFGNEIRPLCFEPDDDALLARGYPHLRRLVDGHKHDQKGKAEAFALKAAVAGKPAYRIEWPREVAHRFVRLGPGSAFLIWTQYSAADDEEKALASQGGAPSVEEARAIVAAMLPRHGCTYNWRVGEVALLLEAMVGSEPIVDAIVSALEALPANRFQLEKAGPDRQLAGHVFYDLGFLLRRVSAAVRAHQRARLEALWTEHHHESKAWEVMDSPRLRAPRRQSLRWKESGLRLSVLPRACR